MSDTTTPRRSVNPKDRDFGIPNVEAMPDDMPAYVKEALTGRQRAILLMLLSGVAGGRVFMISRDALGASANSMQQLWLNGLAGGAGSRDERGTGNTPASSWWWLSTKGEAVARHIKEGKYK